MVVCFYLLAQTQRPHHRPFPATVFVYFFLVFFIHTKKEFCAPWKQKRDEIAEKQRVAAAAAARARREAAVEKEQEGEKQFSVEDGMGIRRASARDGGSSSHDRHSKRDKHGRFDLLREGSEHDIDVGAHVAHADAFSRKRENEGYGHVQSGEVSSTGWERDTEGGPGGGHGAVGSEAASAEAMAMAAGLPGLLREEEMEKAYDIFSGGKDLDFERFLTGLGVLRRVLLLGSAWWVGSRRRRRGGDIRKRLAPKGELSNNICLTSAQLLLNVSYPIKREGSRDRDC